MPGLDKDGNPIVEPTTPPVVRTEAEVISDYLKSKTHIDLVNAQRGQAVKTFQDDKLPDLIKSEAQKIVDAKSHKEPWQVKQEEQQAQIDQLTNEKAAETKSRLIGDNKNKALKLLSDKKLPTGVLDFLVSDNEETTIANVGKFTEMMEAFTLDLKKGAIDSNNTIVPGNTDSTIVGHGIPEPTGDDPKQWEDYYKKVRIFNNKK